MKRQIFYAATALLALSGSNVLAEPLPRLAHGPSLRAVGPSLRAVGPSLDAVPPYEVLAIVRSAGLDPIDRPVRRGAGYIVHAVGETGRDCYVRVLVDARHGEIVDVMPVTAAVRMPRGEYRMGPYEPMAPRGYYRAGPPPIADEYDEPVEVYRRRGPPVLSDSYPAERPLPPLANVGPPGARMAPPVGAPPRVITATPEGMLPPPPDRFQRRAQPPAAVKPDRPKRAAAIVPKTAPLPKARPDRPSSPAALPAPDPAQAAPNMDAAPMPPAIPEHDSDVETVPH